MHITGFHIDGFGVFHDTGVSDLPRGLILFVGANESGKTTAMEFFRTVLFGPKKRALNTYPPLYGGNHGGRVSLTADDGREFVISRQGRTPGVSLDGGPEENIEPGKILFPGLDRKTFEQVFAIGLEDLQGLKVLSGEDVQGSLFSAGTGLGAGALPSTLRAINGEMEELLKPRGSVQRVPKLLKEIRALEKELTQLRGTSAEYAALCQQREELATETLAAREEMDQLAKRDTRLEQLARAREPWTRIREIERQTATLESARSFPPNGLVRYEGMQEKLHELHLERDRRTEEQTRLEEEIGTLVVDDLLLENREEINRLVGERAKIEAADNDRPSRENDLERTQDELAQRLGDLGPDWTVQRLAEVDTSVQVQNRVREFADEVKTALDDYQRSTTRSEEAATRESHLKEVMEDARLHLEQFEGSNDIDRVVLDQRRLALIEIRGQQEQLNLAQVQLEGCKDGLDEAKKMRQMAEQQGPAGQLDPKNLLFVRWIVPAFLLVIAVIAGFLEAYMVGVMVGALAIAVMGFTFWLEGQQEAISADAGQQQLAAAEVRIEQLNAQMADLQQDKESSTNKIKAFAKEAGIEPPEDGTALEHALEECRRETEKLRDREECTRSAQAAQKSWERAQQQTLALRRLSEELQHLRDDVITRWHAWLDERGFAALDRPDQFEVVLKAIDNARVAQQNVQQQQDRVAQVRDYLDDAGRGLAQLLERLGRSAISTSAGVEDIDLLSRDLSSATELASELDNKRQQADRARGEAGSLATQCEKLEKEIVQLWQQADADDEETFRLAADSHQRWNDAEADLAENRVKLESLAGSVTALAEIEAELGRTDPVRLEQEMTETRSRLKELRESVSAKEQESGSLRQRIDDMANDTRLGEALLRENQLKEQLDRCIARWCELVLCREMLEGARKIHEEQRQPQVFQQAKTFLKTMTCNRYQLHATLDEKPEESVVLRGADQSTKQLGTWSSGLGDQTFLAIRLGLTREFGRHAEPLPVILDDVLVRFDLARRADTLRVALKYAEDGQILIYSCRKDLADELARIAQEAEFADTSVACYEIASDGGKSEFRVL